MTGVFTVYEHQAIQIGDSCGGVVFQQRHYEVLCALAERYDRVFFTVTQRGVRFAQYVGILQAGDLTIEVLPKADRGAAPERRVWRHLLIDLLRACRLLPLHRLPASGQQLGRRALLDFYIDIFLEETGDLLRQGLLRDYRRRQGAVIALRGRLLPERQLRLQGSRPTRFFTEHDVYNYDHLFNGILLKALDLLGAVPRVAGRRRQLAQLRRRFPAGIALPAQLPPWETLAFNRRTERYRPALKMAWLLLRRYHPNLQAGNFPAFSLLFDMNALFEEWIYRELRSALPQGVSLQRQLRRPFWNRRYIRPDLLLTIGDRRIVLDTKWKALTRPQPAMADLQQLFVYQHYFRAPEGVLLYPRMPGLQDTASHSFYSATDHQCRLIFIDLLDGQSRLHRNIGKSLLQKLGREG